MFIFSNPNNPTGGVYNQDLIEKISAAAIEHDVFVLADELYTRLVYDGRKSVHIAAIEGMNVRTITFLGPSKTESMSGYRVGAAVGPKALIDRMSDLLYVSAIRCPAYAQHLLARWIADDACYVAARIVEYQGLRDLVVKRLRAMPGVTVSTPGGSSYVFPAFPGLTVDDVTLCSELKRNGLVVSPGFQFGIGATGHIRICFAQEKEDLVRGLDIIEKTLESMRHP